MAEFDNLGLTLTKQIVRTHDKFLVDVSNPLIMQLDKYSNTALFCFANSLTKNVSSSHDKLMFVCLYVYQSFSSHY